ncbi:hypothetical protein SAMN05216223_105385 [Actinacidiphila yanglinensis]|uniref:Uncharacterized protein n=1 Tax=Actinacidiphila yanglinensis TaxID=310779 RepID=A0A1H6AHP5_9ACTN|nr:hypothetical protein [Actinacidiphila yanglinensis]SEG47597.1 hypothetical protein SAMN05216223_105385 [Actinacidiphila yanglinensis]
MGRGEYSGTVPRPRVGDADGPATAHDRAWAGRRRTAYAAAVTVLAAALALDAWDGTLDPARLVLWLVFAVALFAILLPERTTTGEGWLEVRGLLRRRRVYTDYLVSARFLGAIDRRVVLRDAFGGVVSVEAGVLLANPFLWHALDRGARHAHTAGLLADRGALRELAEAIDARGARDLLAKAGM